MKRLIKKAEPISLYHGTNLLSLDEILQSGIAAGILEGSTWNNTTNTQTFYTTTIERAKYYAYMKYKQDGSRNKDGIVVMQISFESDLLEPDKDDVPYANTWQESNDASKQVAVNGSVRADQIEYLYFYNNKEELIVECSKEEYFSDFESIKQQIYNSNMKSDEDELVEKNQTLEEVLGILKQIGMQITKCNKMIYMYDSTEEYPTEFVQPKLDKRQLVVISLIEKVNQYISEYNTSENNLPFIEMEEYTDIRKPYRTDELKGIIIRWFDKEYSTLGGYDFYSEYSLITDFVNHLQQSQNKIAKKRLKNIKKSV